MKQQLNNNMDKSANSKFSSFYCSVFMIPVRALYWPIIDPRELLGTWVRIGVFPVSQYMRKRGEGVKMTFFNPITPGQFFNVDKGQ